MLDEHPGEQTGRSLVAISDQDGMARSRGRARPRSDDAEEGAF